MHKTKKFEKWARSYGVAKLASDLQIEAPTIYYWLKGATAPNLKNVRGILKLAKGALALSDIPGAK